MIWKAILTLAVMALLWPREPDLGVQRPDAYMLELERAHSALLVTLDKIRTDLQSNGQRHH